MKYMRVKIYLLMLFTISTLSSRPQSVGKGSDKKDSVISIYSIRIDSLGGKSKIDFSAYKGKKILIVNTATLDPNFSQLPELDKLQKKNNKELVVLLVPCSDFNTEPAGDREIAAFMRKCKLSFITASKTSVTGKRASPLYQWLTKKSLNGVMDNMVTSAFQKFLIDEKGTIDKSFSVSQRPLRDKQIADAISNTKE